MKILFTGASSFTGMWFIKELAMAGHSITALFPRELDDYDGMRRDRVDHVLQHCTPAFSSRFGSDRFLKIVKDNAPWDLLCHHAADVTDYKSPEFDFSQALVNNTKNLKYVLQLLKERGCQKVLLTGSVFEQGEGEGSDLLRAVSPYGLSKGLTAEVFKFYCHVFKLKLGKFVIPNPFGPYEEPRFTTFLIKSWYEGKIPLINAPDYARDNIPVSLLAKAYRRFAELLTSEPGYQQMNPSYYTGKQGEFTLRFAKEMENRLSIPCRVELQHQNEFSEPHIRINNEPLDISNLDWNEDNAWDELAEFYRINYGQNQNK
jgi:UDP-glucose 4-epimerase